MQWLLWKLNHNWVASRKTRMRWFLKEENSTGETRSNPMQKVLGSIRKVRFTQSTLRQASMREKKGPSLGKIQVKPQHQRSPNAMKFEDRSHDETERQQRCARQQGMEPCQKNIQAQKERQNYIPLASEEVGTTWLRQRKSWRKESLW